MLQLSGWPAYDMVKGFSLLLGDACMFSMLDLLEEEAYALAIINLYCDTKNDQRGQAIANMNKMNLRRAAEWKKQGIEANLPTARNKAAYI